MNRQGVVCQGERNRWKACVELGREVDYFIYEGDDIAEFVIDANNRRDMTDSQHAMVQACIYAADGRRDGGRWQRGTVDNPARGNSEKGGRWERGSLSALPAIGGSADSAWVRDMHRAGTVLDHAPDLAEGVVAGELALDAAHRQAEARRDAERQALAEEERIEAEESDARTRLAESAPGYLQRHATARQAWAAWEDDNRREAARLRQEKATAAKKAAEERSARSDLYTGIAMALSTLGGYGAYKDPIALMAQYDPAELSPAQAARFFSPTNIADARRFLDALTEWSTARV